MVVYQRIEVAHYENELRALLVLHVKAPRAGSPSASSRSSIARSATSGRSLPREMLDKLEVPVSRAAARAHRLEDAGRTRRTGRAECGRARLSAVVAAVVTTAGALLLRVPSAGSCSVAKSAGASSVAGGATDPCSSSAGSPQAQEQEQPPLSPTARSERNLAGVTPSDDLLFTRQAPRDNCRAGEGLRFRVTRLAPSSAQKRAGAPTSWAMRRPIGPGDAQTCSCRSAPSRVLSAPEPPWHPRTGAGT